MSRNATRDDPTGREPGPGLAAGWYAGHSVPRPCGAGHQPGGLAGSPAEAFHQLLPGFGVTPLTEVPDLASRLGVARVLVKDESFRLGLGAFKVLGASWAICQLLTGGADGGVTLDELRREAARREGLAFVTATDGNHGRAVAWTARLLGVAAQVFVPDVITAATIGRIASLGATVTRVQGRHDDAVSAAAQWVGAHPGTVLVQDTGWPGYEQVAGWIVAGYSTLFREIDAQAGAAGVDLVCVPVGVGSLAQAAVAHYQGRPPAILSVEPDSAACLLASLRAGRPVTVSTGATVMAGLNCGTVSSVAWPSLAAGIAGAVSVSDGMAADAEAELLAAGVSTGPTGAASLAGAVAALTGPGSAERRAHLAVGSGATVILLNTEGAPGS